MAQGLEEKLENTGPVKKEKIASLPQKEQLVSMPEPPLPKQKDRPICPYHQIVKWERAKVSESRNSPLKPAPFCKLFAGLGSINKSATSLLFSSYLTLVLSSPPSFLLPQFLADLSGTVFFLSPLSIRLQ